MTKLYVNELDLCAAILKHGPIINTVLGYLEKEGDELFSDVIIDRLYAYRRVNKNIGINIPIWVDSKKDANGFREICILDYDDNIILTVTKNAADTNH